MQTYGDGTTNEGNSVAVDSGGNVYVTGKETSFGHYIPAEIRFGGNFQWIQEYILGTFGAGNGVAVDSGDNIYITGQSPGRLRMFLRKYDSAGAFQWMRTYNSGGGIDDEETASLLIQATIFMSPATRQRRHDRRSCANTIPPAISSGWPPMLVQAKAEMDMVSLLIQTIILT